MWYHGMIRNHCHYWLVGLGGLGITCSPRNPRLAASNPAEVDGFFRDVKILSSSPPGGNLSWGSRVWDFTWARKYLLVWRCHQLLSWFLVNGQLPRVSCQACLFANDERVIGMLLVSWSGHVEEDAVEVFRYYVFTCPLLSRCKISSPFRENNNVVVFLFPFHIFMRTCDSPAFKDSFLS